jgi:hypothetical protein
MRWNAAEGGVNIVSLESSAITSIQDGLSTLDINTEIVEGTITVVQLLRLYLSVLTGLSGGGNTGTVRFRDLADTKDRVVATVNSSGDRTSVTLDGD